MLAVDVHAAAIRPQRVELGDDALAERVAGPGECEGCVRVQAFDRSGAPGAADAELERRAGVAAGLAGRELAAERTLVGIGSGAAPRQHGAPPCGGGATAGAGAAPRAA